MSTTAAAHWARPVARHLASYAPRPPRGFRPQRIVLTRGALATEARRAFAERLCAVYPQARRLEALDRTHMQLAGLLPRGSAARREAGRRTLVLGTMGSVLRRSTESRICCPNYLHISPTSSCTYACAYCYLAGTRSSVLAPAAKIHLNLEDLLAAVRRRARRLESPTSFYLGKLQDALGLDPLSGFSRVLVPFFADQPRARLVMLSKSDAVGTLLDLDHRGHTALSWSVNPEAVCREFEWGAAPLARRLDAARRCRQAGYPVRFLIMPILPVEGWRRRYAELVDALFEAAEPQRITLGGMCSFPNALAITRQALGAGNLLDRHVARQASADGRRRYPRELRVRLYRHLLEAIRRRAPRLPVGLCLEEREVWEACGLSPHPPACNCIW